MMEISPYSLIYRDFTMLRIRFIAFARGCPAERTETGGFEANKSFDNRFRALRRAAFGMTVNQTRCA